MGGVGRCSLEPVSTPPSLLHDRPAEGQPAQVGQHRHVHREGPPNPLPRRGVEHPREVEVGQVTRNGDESAEQSSHDHRRGHEIGRLQPDDRNQRSREGHEDP